MGEKTRTAGDAQHREKTQSAAPNTIMMNSGRKAGEGKKKEGDVTGTVATEEGKSWS